MVLRHSPKKVVKVITKTHLKIIHLKSKPHSLDYNEEQNLLNTLRPRQNGCHFPDSIFKQIFLNENVWISMKISPKFVPKVPINNSPTLVQIMAWCRPGDKPSFEPMMVSSLTHIYASLSLNWVKQATSLFSRHNSVMHICVTQELIIHWPLGDVAVILN